MGRADWRTIIADQVAVKAAETREKNTYASDTAHISRVGLTVQAHHFLVRAARRRGISISGYIRRATLAFVAADLGMKPEELFELDSGITPIGRRGAPASKDLDGELYGKWEVQPGDSGDNRE